MVLDHIVLFRTIIIYTLCASIFHYSQQLQRYNVSNIHSTKRILISTDTITSKSGPSSTRKRYKVKDNYPLSNTNIHLLPVSSSFSDIPFPWKDIPSPIKSYFAGFDPPSDKLKWNQALLQASRGEQVLLSRVLRVIQSPFDLWKGMRNL